MLNEMKSLIDELLYYSDAYYNKNQSLISDAQFDRKIDRLKELERNSGIVLSNSPTINVGFKSVSKLSKVKHGHPMLSLDKSKNINDIKTFIKVKKSLAMLKMDGLTVTLTYNNGELVAAETRGDGFIGEDVLHNAKQFSNIPLRISYQGEFIVDGEAIIDSETFEKINRPLIEQSRREGIEKGLSGVELDDYINDNSYKNSRNLVSGSVRQLNSEVAASRNIKFIAWKSIKGIEYDSFMERLDTLKSYGFEVVPYIEATELEVDEEVEYLKCEAKKRNYPIDGIVFSFDSVSYGDSLGATTHHVRSQIAYKFYDDEKETVLKDVEWSLGRTGVITPVAVFQPVDIEGTIVERASLHNVSVFNSFELGVGDTVQVYKANMIIPQISDNQTRTGTCTVPDVCPVCGGRTRILRENSTDILVCVNPDCEGKLLSKISNFVSRSGMNIDGFSKKSIEKLIDKNFIKDFPDIYTLYQKKHILKTLDGFGNKKVDNLLGEIEKSKNVTLDRFLCALGIHGLGISGSKKISNKFNGDFYELEKAIEEGYNFSEMEDFGFSINRKIHDYWEKNKEMIKKLSDIMIWEKEDHIEQKLQGKVFVITGKLSSVSRGELIGKIESFGGTVSSSVSKKTDYLINNDPESKSSKNLTAKKLGVPIITEKEILKIFL